MMMEAIKQFMASWTPVFDGEGEGEGEGEGAGSGSGSGDKSFNQDEVNSLLAQEKRKAKEQIDAISRELDALKTRSNLTSEERQELEERLKRVEAERLTKEEQLTRELERVQTDAKTTAEKLTSERDRYVQLFTDQSINAAIAEASSEHKAYKAEQINALLHDSTKLVEALDSEGKPTGGFVPEVSYQTVDKDGKDITLKLTVKQAVARLKEDGHHPNLFEDSGTGGTGGSNSGSGGSEDWAAIYADPEAYRKAKAEGKIA